MKCDECYGCWGSPNCSCSCHPANSTESLQDIIETIKTEDKELLERLGK